MNERSKSSKKEKALRVVITVLILGVLLYIVQLLYLLRADSPRGFVLPEGNIAAGKAAFVELGCIQCHTVRDISLPSPEKAPAEGLIELGGTQRLAKTYGQLVTSIMHPSAELHHAEGRYTDSNGASRMPNYQSQMTVEQLVDIVRFLQEHYNVFVPDYDPGYYYTPYGYYPTPLSGQ